MRIDYYSPAGAFLLISLFLVTASFSCSRQPRHPSPPQTGGDVVVDIASLQDGVPRFFTYRYQERNISFFVLKLGNDVSSFLDACASCYHQKLGYRYEKGYVRCGACGTTLSVHKLEKGLGGCYPVRLAGRRDKGNYRISLDELRKHAGKF